MNCLQSVLSLQSTDDLGGGEDLELWRHHSIREVVWLEVRQVIAEDRWMLKRKFSDGVLPCEAKPTLLWDVKVNASLEPRSKLHWTPGVQEVTQVKATRSKTPWDAVCRTHIFRSLALQFSVPNKSKSPVRTRPHAYVQKHIKDVCPRVLKQHVDAYTYTSSKNFCIVV